MSPRKDPKETVSCPGCGRKHPKISDHSIYWCEHCRCQFDNDPDEGSDYSDYDPAWRLEREERRARRQSKQRRR